MNAQFPHTQEDVSVKIEGDVTPEEFVRRVMQFGTIFEIVMSNGPVLIAIGESEGFISALNDRNAPRFVTIPVINLRNGLQTDVTVNVSRIAMISPNRSPREMVNEDVPAKTNLGKVLWKKEGLN